MKTGEKNQKTEIFYNGSCSICAPEILMYEKMAVKKNGAENSPLDFIDISISAPDGLAPDGMAQDDMLKRLHARLPNGEIVSGVHAFITLWGHLPGFVILARFVDLPFIRPLAEQLYDRVLAPTLYKRYLRNKTNKMQK